MNTWTIYFRFGATYTGFKTIIDDNEQALKEKQYNISTEIKGNRGNVTEGNVTAAYFFNKSTFSAKLANFGNFLI